MNGAAYLSACLSSHMPLDLVVIMLGSNDLNVKYNRSAEEIAGGVDELVKIVKEAQWQKNTKFQAPQVLLLAPPMMNIQNEKNKAMFAGASVVSYGEAEDEIHLTLKTTAILPAQ